MTLLRDAASAAPDAGAVLGRAALRAAGRLGVTHDQLARVIGVSPSTVSRLKSGAARLEADQKSFELAALFVRLFRSLDAIAGGDERTARAWMRAENLALGRPPIERIQTVAGLVDVVDYLDARRAPL
ncbi:MbcA/ParS/Xre antitoxin family protein [uncultured Albimonas sp.]|uniref:MbcA/ParS/Xre antitoxin family protein n=1 Tax=uncultured Albimonas sp. TaxID=1331701 RepID=UPI0030EC543A|tara:strand:- start:831 stop:1214 length:384 start_codon:yes stop_codon:yes gene_type:complete